MKKLLLTLCFSLTAVFSYAYDFEKDGLYYNLLTTSTVEVTKGDAPYEGNVICIPESVTYSNHSCAVVKIGDDAFKYANIDNVKIPHSVTQIGAASFCNSEINQLLIPANVEKIGSECFWGCNKLESVTFESSDKSLWFDYNFVGGRDHSIAFDKCNNLNTIYIDRDLYYASADQTSWKDNVISIFYNLSSLKKVYFGENALNIGNYFSGCSNIETIEIPANIHRIGGFAFKNCSGLSKLIFRNGNKTISRDSFYGCTSLTMIDFCEGDLTIGSYVQYAEHGTFENCTNLQALVFPNNYSVSIESGSFKNCKQIKNIYSKATYPSGISENAFEGITFLTATLYVPVGAKGMYETTKGWNQFSQIIETDNFDVSSDMHTIGLSVSDGGKVVCGDTEITNYSYSWSVDSNTSLTLQIIPHEGYVVKKVEINNEDVTGEVQNGILKLDGITSDKRIYINFEKEETLLSIKEAELGSVSLVAENGKSYTFVLSPSEGWEIESVSFNGDNVTSQLDGNKYTTPAITLDSELSIVYKQVESSAVKSYQNENNVRIFASYGKVTIENAGVRTNVAVYTTSGTIVASEPVGVGSTTIELPTNNIYIVKVGEQTFKVSM